MKIDVTELELANIVDALVVKQQICVATIRNLQAQAKAQQKDNEQPKETDTTQKK